MKINVSEKEEKPAAEKKPEVNEVNEVKAVPSTDKKRSKKDSIIGKMSKVKMPKVDIKKPNFKKIKANKKMLLAACCAVVVIVAVVVAIVILRTPKVDDSYFVSDENKDVITLEVSKADAATTNLIRTHIVYTYADDQITSLKTYYEYENNELASQAFENTKSINQNAESVDLNDKYIVVTAKSDQYESLTPSDIKQQAEAIRQFQAAQKESEEKSEEKTEE